MKNLKAGALSLTIWFLLPHSAWAEEFLYLPIARTPVITVGFCGYRTPSGACHGGIDYDVRDDGDGIFVAAAGTVEVAEDGWSNTLRKKRVYGNYVQILHDNGYRTIYGHLKSGTLEVAVGDEVRAGERLGTGDNSGWSTGSHLHFEVRDASGHKVDPYGETPHYPNCGSNSLWVVCPPGLPDADEDADTWTVAEGDCDDTNPDIHPDADERCDNLDNNCVDGVDEEPAASYSCRDSVDCTFDVCRSDAHVCSQFANHAACEDGDSCTTDLCLLWVGCRTIPRDEDLDTYTDSSCGGDDCDDSDFHIHPEAPERCNYLDDDCDGETDEDWRTGLSVDLGEPCAVGVGACYRTGVWDCEPLHRGTVCTAEIVSGTTEVCDGLDNDCNGTADDSYCTIDEWATVYCCDGLAYGQDSVCVQIEEPSSLYVRWDIDTCALSSGRTRAGSSCSVSSQCMIYDFSGVCRLSCASHAGFCLHDTSFSYCTKQCTSDAECPAAGRCRLTVTIDSPDVRLCRYGY